MSCINIRVRSKKYHKYFYCIKRKKEIELSECNICKDYEYKQRKTISKKSNKKIYVSKETYQKVYERDKGTCQLLDENCQYGLELHHIVYRSEDKSKINDINNCILLCNYHHRLVHSNKNHWQPILFKIVKKN